MLPRVRPLFCLLLLSYLGSSLLPLCWAPSLPSRVFRSELGVTLKNRRLSILGLAARPPSWLRGGRPGPRVEQGVWERISVSRHGQRALLCGQSGRHPLVTPSELDVAAAARLSFCGSNDRCQRLPVTLFLAIGHNQTLHLSVPHQDRASITKLKSAVCRLRCKSTSGMRIISLPTQLYHKVARQPERPRRPFPRVRPDVLRVCVLHLPQPFGREQSLAIDISYLRFSTAQIALARVHCADGCARPAGTAARGPHAASQIALQYQHLTAPTAIMLGYGLLIHLCAG